MPTTNVRNLAGIDITITQEDLDGLTASVRGQVLLPGSTAYDTARTIWNAMIDRRPGLIVRAASAADVVKTVQFARRHQLLLAIKGAGHNIAGNAVCDGGLMLDLSLMKSVHIDQQRRVATVEPGCTLADFDHDAQVFGLATPLGINSTTGVAGLTLGGGFGWLTRKYGMSVDNLIAADVVLADGTLVRASSSSNDDLFWAIRGGGGNFGVVTSFEFQLHPVGPEVLSGLIVHPFADAPKLLRQYRDFIEKAPDEVVAWFVIRKAPPLPFLPESIHGKEMLAFACFYAGDITSGERALEGLRRFGQPIADVVQPHPYTGWQKAFDPLLTPGARNYWKSHNFTQLEDGYLDTLLDYSTRLPSPHCEIFVGALGGAANRVPRDATAYPQRDAKYVMNVHGRWETAAEDETCIRWARELTAATARYATGGVYINFVTADETDRIQAAYGENYTRLVSLKQKYDPTNMFRMNHNIQPVAAV
ncbi:MAG: FAD-linked oxidase [Acidobacteria bacterium RIFCSPLOWO2_02_FULL_67_36]|nr:MAG: FAD-linked oxidase [Acidobacteria bacterium RIFCSPLOWO2_02_FULL_67_36]OFW25325.1 MAG: FAD-linked oxidase [Acidobacteria bacterium RIFCSPLOWO2_12_FULL_66_21]